MFDGAVRLPGALGIQGRTDVSVSLPADKASGNMQTDAAAFEAWVLALRIAGAASVTLRLDGRAKQNGHFAGFRYRAARFSELFSPWFRTEAPWTSPIPAYRTSGCPAFFLNVGSAKRTGMPKCFDDRALLDLDAPESEIEVALTHAPRVRLPFCSALNLTGIDRQLPVGVFRHRVADPTKVFVARRRAIDIWGVLGQRLAIFELKNRSNKKVGAFTELLFYALVIHDLQSGIIAFDPAKAAGVPACSSIEATTELEAFILAPTFHPLIAGRDAEMIRLVNLAFARSERRVQLGLARLLESSPFVQLGLE